MRVAMAGLVVVILAACCVAAAGSGATRDDVDRIALLGVYADCEIDSLSVTLVDPGGDRCTLGWSLPNQGACGFVHPLKAIAPDSEGDPWGWWLAVNRAVTGSLSVVVKARVAARVDVSPVWLGACFASDSLWLKAGESAQWSVAWSELSDLDTCWVRLRRADRETSGVGERGE